MASGGGTTPLIVKKSVKKRCYQNPLKQLLKQFLKLYELWRPVMWPLLERWYTGNQWFWFFLRISRRVLIFLLENFLCIKIWSSCSDKHQNIDNGCTSYPGNKARSPNFGRFWRFRHFSSCLFWHKPLA